MFSFSTDTSGTCTHGCEGYFGESPGGLVVRTLHFPSMGQVLSLVRELDRISQKRSKKEERWIIL